MIGPKVFIRHALSPVNEISQVRPLTPSAADVGLLTCNSLADRPFMAIEFFSGLFPIPESVWSDIQDRPTNITRAHSFRGPRNFEPNRGILDSAEFNRGIRLFTAEYPAEFDVFHSNNYFFTENDLKVALLQVCL